MVPHIYTIKVQEAYELLQKDAAILIDVREAEEFHMAHIPQALSLPLSLLDDALSAFKPNPDKIWIFHCRSGSRSKTACVQAQLASQEKTSDSILSLEGGITAWRAAGHPVIEEKQVVYGEGTL